MRLAVVDVGNTSTAVGLWQDGRVSHVSHCDGGFGEASKAAEALVRRCDALAYVSVVPEADDLWRAFAKKCALPLRQVSCRCFPPAVRAGKFPRLEYPKPETIGADRLADAAGAVARYGAPVLVMDFGTALTAT